MRERGAVPRDGLVRLTVLDRERNVIGHRDENVEVAVVRAAQRVRLVDGQHSEQEPADVFSGTSRTSSGCQAAGSSRTGSTGGV
jgi:hypothetical protein